MSFIEALAEGIAKANAGLPSHCIRFTTGEHKGRYLGWNYNTVKHKRSAMTLVRHEEHDKWFEHNRYAIEKHNGEFEVIARRK